MLLVKKLSLILICLIFVFSAAYSQNFNFGVSVKMISSDILLTSELPLGANYQKNTYRGFSFGAAGLLSYSFAEKWNIIAEPGYLFTKHGEDVVSANFPAEPVRLDLEHYYLGLPILLQYRIWDRIGIELGPEINYLINFESSDPFSSKSHYESLNLAANLGISFAVLDFLDLGLRYNRGLTPFFKSEITDQDGQPSDWYIKDYHQSFQGSLRLWF